MNEENIKSVLSFKKYLIKNTIFEINDDYKKDKLISLDLDIDFVSDIDKENGIAMLSLYCKVFESAKENNYPFSLSVEIVGFYKFEIDTEHNIKEIIEINGSAILFPYLRSYITTLTSNAGISPLILPTINIVKLINEKTK